NGALKVGLRKEVTETAAGACLEATPYLLKARFLIKRALRARRRAHRAGFAADPVMEELIPSRLRSGHPIEHSLEKRQVFLPFALLQFQARKHPGAQTVLIGRRKL